MGRHQVSDWLLEFRSRAGAACEGSPGFLVRWRPLLAWFILRFLLGSRARISEMPPPATPAAAALPRSGAGPWEEGRPGRGKAGRARAQGRSLWVTAASRPGRSVGTRCRRPTAPRLCRPGGSHAEQGQGDHKGLRDVQAPSGLRNTRKTLASLKFTHLADTKIVKPCRYAKTRFSWGYFLSNCESRTFIHCEIKWNWNVCSFVFPKSSPNPTPFWFLRWWRLKRVGGRPSVSLWSCEPRTLGEGLNLLKRGVLSAAASNNSISQRPFLLFLSHSGEICI